MQEVLAEAEERFERRYVLKTEGYDLERIALRVGEIFDIDARYVLSKGGERRRVQARTKGDRQIMFDKPYLVKYAGK